MQLPALRLRVWTEQSELQASIIPASWDHAPPRATLTEKLPPLRPHRHLGMGLGMGHPSQKTITSRGPDRMHAYALCTQRWHQRTCRDSRLILAPGMSASTSSSSALYTMGDHCAPLMLRHTCAALRLECHRLPHTCICATAMFHTVPYAAPVYDLSWRVTLDKRVACQYLQQRLPSGVFSPSTRQL